MTREPERASRDTRFRKGQSGNPKGRPKKKQEERASAFDIIIDRTLTVTQDGVPRDVSVEEALQHRTYQDAIAGKRMAERKILKMIAKREAYLADRRRDRTIDVAFLTEPVDPDNADEAMLLLGIAAHDSAKQHIPGDRHQLLLEPWAVQAALSRRRGSSLLEEKEIAEIRCCTRDAAQLRWPRGMR